MSYTPYLIANYSTGLDRRLQPWLIPDDAQEYLYDGYVYRGTMSKREGYTYFATGQRGMVPYRESRIIHTLVDEPAAEAPDGIIVTFTLAGNGQIARGSVTVNGSNPVVVGTDDGLGVISGAGIVTGSVDYLTGAISVTFSVAPVALSTVTFTYSFMPGDAVMMVANFITAVNVIELIVADLQYVNRYDPTTNTLVDISPASPYTGTKYDFFTWVNYPDATDNPRLLFCNNIDVVQEYDGTTVTDYAYTSADFSTLTASFMVTMKDRLILLRTTEDGVTYPQRIRISGTGTNCDVFDTTATGAGFIDIPDGTWINGAAFSQDDLLIFTQAQTWVMKYTGNDTTPFVVDRIDASRGSDATFSVFTYLNRTSAASTRGLIISDGYRVERQDELIPDFSFNEIDGANFSLCFAGSVDIDRDHYLIYPPQGATESRRILVTNYDEANYSIYRLPLSCMGHFITASSLTWNDLLIYSNWDSLANDYGNWNSFAYTAGAPFSIGGGHHGEVWRLAVTESEDNPVKIRDITVIDDATIEVTTDWNNYSLNDDDQSMGADYIFLTGMTGMEEINDNQFPIIEVTDHNVFRLNVSSAVVPASQFTAYVEGGTAVRVIPFDALFKKFNPYVEIDKKVQCGWLYMYVDSAGTSLQRDVPILSATQTNPCVITTTINHGLTTGNQVLLFNVGGMVELNGQEAFVTVISADSFSLDGVDATGYTAYTSGGYVATPELAKLIISVIVNDLQEPTQLNNTNPDPYQGRLTNMVLEDDKKRWYKVFINQTGRFIQFKFSNKQAGATVNIQATMPGFKPVGRLI